MDRRVEKVNLSEIVAEKLIDQIRSGKFAKDRRLPSVEKLAQKMGVGMSSIREALTQLHTLGFVKVLHGKGVFVTNARIDFDLTHLTSFSETMRRRHLKPGARVLINEVIQASSSIAAKLELEVDEAINHLVRLRLADGTPMALESSFTPYSRFPELARQDLTDRSLYQFLKEKYGCHPSFANLTIQATIPSVKERKLLGLSGKQPVLLVEGLSLDHQRRPFEYGRSLYRADRYQYSLNLGPTNHASKV